MISSKFRINPFFLLACGGLLFVSCSTYSEDESTDTMGGLSGTLFVQSLSYTRTEDNETRRMEDLYNYEKGSIVRRVETDLDSGNIRVFEYTYANELISSVHGYNTVNDLHSEINIYYNDNNQVSSYEYTGNLNTNSPTYSLASFYYTENQILHCDGQRWSSVEYKDVYDNVFAYVTNEDGDIVQIDEVVDCDFSASTTTSSPKTDIEYDNNYSPFINVNGNNLILDDVIGIFTDSRVRGSYNNATRLSRAINGEQETQVWGNQYNDAGYPITIQWSLDTNREDVEITYY